MIGAERALAVRAAVLELGVGDILLRDSVASVQKVLQNHRHVFGLDSVRLELAVYPGASSDCRHALGRFGGSASRSTNIIRIFQRPDTYFVVSVWLQQDAMFRRVVVPKEDQLQSE